jgi:mono/diheme cytochrome c family protein
MLSNSNQNPQNIASSPSKSDPYFGASIVMTVGMTITLPLILGLVAMAKPSPVSTQVTPVAITDADTNAFAQAKQLASGRELFSNACVVCHGQDGEGVPRLGKPLRNSAYVQETSDQDMFQLIAEGRAIDDPSNTSGVMMPPRGAVGFNDAQLHDVIAYLRDMQDPSVPTVSVDAWDLSNNEDGGLVALQLDDHPGYQLYISSCAACHGEGAEGVEGIGLPLTTSGFVRGESDDDLVKFVKMGRPIWDMNNTTGIDMPPKGGNPAITDDQLHQIVVYLRALQEQALASN